MKKVFGIAFLAVFTMLFTAGLETAQADNDHRKKHKSPEAKLKGTYFRARTRTCIRTNGIFDTNNRVAPAYSGQNPYAHTRTHVISGNMTFNGDGTGSMEHEGHWVRNVTSAAQGGTSPQFNMTGQGTCDFNYTVNPDNSFDLVTTSCISPTATTSGAAIQGQIARGGQSLILYDTDSNVETITPNSGGIIRRICNRSGSAIKVKK